MGLSVKKCENWKKMAKNNKKIEFVGQFFGERDWFEAQSTPKNYSKPQNQF